MIYSTTEITTDDLEYLNESLNSKYLGQATDISSLTDIISNYLNKDANKSR